MTAEDGNLWLQTHTQDAFPLQQLLRERHLTVTLYVYCLFCYLHFLYYSPTTIYMRHSSHATRLKQYYYLLIQQPNNQASIHQTIHPCIQPTQWRTLLLQKLTNSQAVPIFSASFIDPEGSILSSQQPAICPYLKPHESSPRLPILFLEDPF